jgi:hypothetical protein
MQQAAIRLLVMGVLNQLVVLRRRSQRVFGVMFAIFKVAMHFLSGSRCEQSSYRRFYRQPVTSSNFSGGSLFAGDRLRDGQALWHSS